MLREYGPLYTIEVGGEKMSFGAGMGAGMGAGIGSGLAIGVSTGRKRVCEEICEYIDANGMTIRDRTGVEVDVEEFLSNAVRDRASSGQGSKALLAILVLLGLAALSLLSYVAFFG